MALQNNLLMIRYGSKVADIRKTIWKGHFRRTTKQWVVHQRVVDHLSAHPDKKIFDDQTVQATKCRADS